MADNVTLDAMTGGDVCAADDIAGVKHQRVKISLGADGSATDALGGTGVDAAGVQRVSLATDIALPAGTNAIGKLAANSGVDIGDVDITSVVPGTGATNLGKAEDAAHSSGDVGVMALTVRQNTAAALSGTDADYQPLVTDGSGRLHVVNSAGIAGDVAHDAADSGNPVKIGGKSVARGATPTAVSDNDRSNILATKSGALYVEDSHPNIDSKTWIATGALTDDNILPAIDTTLRYVIKELIVTLGGQVTVATSVLIGWGATTIPALGASGADGVSGIVLYHPGMVPGTGIVRSPITIFGAAGEELRITNGAPTSGTLAVTVVFYTEAV